MPLTARKTCQNLVQGTQKSKINDWHIEIAVPKSHTVSYPHAYNDKSKIIDFTRTSKKTGADATIVQDMEYDYASVDEKPDCSSVSNLVNSSNFETKCVTDAYERFENSAMTSSMEMNQRSESGEVFNEHLTSERMQERQSMDSTVTEISPLGKQGCCSQTRNELSCIRQQLMEIESKQSNLMDLLQVI